jgi:two-component system sensor histidine kinase UhpB
MENKFDAIILWLMEPGVKMLCLNDDLTVRSASVYPASVTKDWEGLPFGAFIRSRVVLSGIEGPIDLDSILGRAHWEGLGRVDVGPGVSGQAEISYVRMESGGALLRWKCLLAEQDGGDDLLSLIFNTLTQGMMITDLDGIVLRINPAIYQRMGQTPEDRLGKPFWESHEWKAMPESIERVRNDIIRVVSGESVSEIYTTVPFGDRKVYLKAKMHPVRDSSGRIRYIAIEGTPATREVEERKELDLQKTIIRTFFEFIPLPVWVIDITGKLIMMNDAYAEVYGLSESDIGKNIYARRSEKISEQCIRNNQHVFRSGIPLHSVEYIKDLKGHTRIFHVTKFPIDTQEGEALIGGVSLDMTDKINADQKLRKALERFEYVSEATNDLIYDWDLQTGSVKLVGNAFGIFEDLKDREVHISDLQGFIQADDMARQKKRLEKAIKNRQVNEWQAEFRISDRDGGYLHVLDRAVIHRDGTGMAYRIIGSIQDITVIHRLNKTLQDSQKLDFQRSQRIAYEVAERERNSIADELHDKVNPLLAAARLHIGVSEADPEISGENLLHSKTLIFDAIDVIRNLSQRISIGMVRDRPLDDILRGFLKKFQTDELPIVSVTGKKVEGIRDLYFKMNVLRIVQEQFVNALKYAKAKEFLVNLQVKQDQLHLLVRDDGVGFDPIEGKEGLGLSNISGRVEAYGGKLRIHSSPGQGCRLDIVLPLPKFLSSD